MCDHYCNCRPKRKFLLFIKICRLCAKTKWLGRFNSFFMFENDKNIDWCKYCLRRDKENLVKFFQEISYANKNEYSAKANFFTNPDLVRYLSGYLV